WREGPEPMTRRWAGACAPAADNRRTRAVTGVAVSSRVTRRVQLAGKVGCAPFHDGLCALPHAVPVAGWPQDSAVVCGTGEPPSPAPQRWGRPAAPARWFFQPAE